MRIVLLQQRQALLVAERQQLGQAPADPVRIFQLPQVGTNQAQPMAISSTASRASEVDSRWLGSNTAAEWRPTTGCRWLQSRARASSESAWPATAS